MTDAADHESHAVRRSMPQGGGWARIAEPAIGLPLAAAAALIAVAVLAPILAPHDPLFPAGDPFLPPSAAYPLGTDSVGRDLLSRVLVGTRSTLLAAFVVIASGIAIGTVIGLVAGMAGGIVDQILMRAIDAFLAMPAPILAIAVVGALGASLENTVIAMVVVWWPLYARIVRGEARAFLARPAAEAARLNRVGMLRLGLRHLLPGMIPPIVIAATFDVGLLVLMLAGLSFLGLGSPSPAPELGAMSARGLAYLLQFWWVPVMPGLAVFVLSYVANFAGDALRDLMEDR